MSLPEISRRCLSCGAAVRAGSRFCPQCGNALGAEARPGAAVPATGEPAGAAEESTPAKEAPRTKDWTPPTKEFAAFEQSRGAAGAQAPPPEPEPVAASVEPEPVVVSTPQPREEEGQEAEEDEAGGDVDAGRAGDLRGRVARVREETRARVGRMREEAIVVLEEAPADSGLRFVLAAAALFLVFLVLLFLSTTVLR